MSAASHAHFTVSAMINRLYLESHSFTFSTVGPFQQSLYHHQLQKQV
jgi:hypothetical protein